MQINLSRILTFPAKFLALLLLFIPNSYAESTPQWQAFNQANVNHYIIPAYQNLRITTEKLHKATEAICRDTQHPQQALNEARLAFHDSMDAWQYIQNIQFGPIQILMRNYSMQFWPDKKNHVGKHLAQFLNSQDPQMLRDAEFHKVSVSIKGLPAIERFLFDQNESQALLEKAFNCQVLVKIAAYTADSAKALANEWQEMKQQFADTGSESSDFEDDIDAATTLLKTLVEPIEVIRDLKLLRPMGSGFGQQKMTRLESWRSERSLRNLQINIESLAQFYQGPPDAPAAGLSQFLTKQTDTAIQAQFSLIKKQLAAIPAPMETAIESETAYLALLDLSEALKVLHSQLETALVGLNIHLGFNSRDGD